MLDTIAADWNNVLTFLHSVTVKSPRIIAVPLLPHVDKHVYVWFRRWVGNNILPTTNAPQDIRELTGVLSDVATRLRYDKSLCPIVRAQREEEKEIKGSGCLLPTAKRVILAESATNRTSIPISLPPTIHIFLNARNSTALQSDWALTYVGHKINLSTTLYQALLQGYILKIPDLDSPTGLSPLLTPPHM